MGFVVNLICKNGSVAQEIWETLYYRTTNALPTTMKTNFPCWTLREVVFILLCSKPATSEYVDLIHANKKSLFTLSICSSRLQAVATCPIKSRVTISHLIGQRSIARGRSKLQRNTTVCSGVLTLMRLTTDECIAKSLSGKQLLSKLPITQKSYDRAFRQAECENSFFQSYSKDAYFVIQ